jgi:hypothetical protein
VCALCGVLASDHWAERGGGARARVFRVRLVNRVLAHYGLSLDDWSGAVYTLRDRKGSAVVVPDLGTLWLEAARLAGRPLDPLDPALVASLAAGEGASPGGSHAGP